MRANGLVWGLRVADRRVEFVSYISAFYFVALVVSPLVALRWVI